MRLRKQKEAAGGVATAPMPNPRRRKRIRNGMILAILVIVAVVVFLRIRSAGAMNKNQTAAAYVEETVQRRDITSSLSYSGTLEPADSYTVTSLVSGEILTADFEEGDQVHADDVLYTVDSSDAATGVERAENSLTQAQRAYAQAQESLADLNVKSTAAGQLVELQVEVGDQVNAGQTVALVRDSSTMSIELPFPADEAANFYVGQGASVTIEGSYETLGGTVTAINAADTVLTGNRIVRMVTIEVANPGAITSATTATAMVGASACADSAAFSYKAEKNVTAKVSGEVASLPVAEGSWVSKDQTLVVLTSDTLEDQVENAADQVDDAQLSLDNQQDTLENYTITSPIDGTIIDKTYKQGDNLESGKQLCTIFDLSYLTFTMNVDELDISLMEVGQTVEITADALEGQTFEGVITKVSINGTTSGGVTSYPVTVQIDETDGLLPGMNVDATVIISQSLDVVAVPVEAVSRGNRVLVKTDGADAAQEGNAEGIPAGYAYVEVTLGDSDDDYIEIVSGLSEGDQIAYQRQTSDSMDFAGFPMGEMGGGVVVTTTDGGPGGGGGGAPASGGGMGGGPGGGF